MRWLFVDRITSVEIGESITGIRAVGLTEDYFADHFPGFPVMPGVLVLESLAQLSGKLIELSVYEDRGFWPWPILSMIHKAKFRRFIRPGSQVKLEAEVIDFIREESAMMSVAASVDGTKTTSAELTFIFNPEELPEDAEKLEEEERRAIRQIWPEYDEFLKTSRKAAELEDDT